MGEGLDVSGGEGRARAASCARHAAGKAVERAEGNMNFADAHRRRRRSFCVGDKLGKFSRGCSGGEEARGERLETARSVCLDAVPRLR